MTIYNICLVIKYKFYDIFCSYKTGTGANRTQEYEFRWQVDELEGKIRYFLWYIDPNIWHSSKRLFYNAVII